VVVKVLVEHPVVSSVIAPEERRRRDTSIHHVGFVRVTGFHMPHVFNLEA
jgi:hypothetical protein